MINLGSSCRTNPIRAIDAREETFDILRIAEYLGWEKLEAESDDIVSGKRCPRFKLMVMQKGIHGQKNVIAITEERSEASYGPTIVLKKPEMTRFLYFFVDTEDGGEQEVKMVTITNSSGSQIIIRKEFGLQKQNEPTYNFLAII
ncbi:MAG: hypothetical protein HYW90_02100 [Candidatus Sungbacteria bacterium]|nr:hypothetical protein [Candidatus Sungbacteria bacterium]